MMQFSQNIQRLLRQLTVWMPYTEKSPEKKLLDASEVRELAEYVQTLPPLFGDFSRVASQSLLGETPARFRGRGFDFEENRVYQAGDDVRTLNWHLYARNGSLHTKVFNEERRPQVFVLLDRRGSMRFGTRRQLKIELAAKIATCCVYLAQQSSLAVGAVMLDETIEWLDPAVDPVSIQNLINTMISACPPIDFERDQPGIEQILYLLLQQLPSGCFVMLLSDFLDMEPAIGPLMCQLSERHLLHAIQILDPIEQRLPKVGRYLINDGGSGGYKSINGGDRIQAQQYAVAVEKHQSLLADLFRGSEVAFTTLSTQDDVETSIGKVYASFPGG